MKKRTKFGRLIRWGLGLALAGIALILLMNLTVIIGGAGNIIRQETVQEKAADGEHFDCIMVLGCGVYVDGTPTPMLKDRLDTAIGLYEAGLAPKLLLSGDHGTVGYNEVAGMYSYARAAGIPEEDLFLDHAGFSTYESVYRAKAIFGVKNILVVTQGYHLYRAMFYARCLDLDGYGVKAQYYPYSGELYRQSRELLSRVKAFAYGIIKPLPTYLGDTIDITGDGTVTHDFK